MSKVEVEGVGQITNLERFAATHLHTLVMIDMMPIVARIILFIYVFYQLYRHRAQVLEMHTFGMFLVICVPFVLSVMNLMWFGKIIKGLKKTLAKQGCIDQ